MPMFQHRHYKEIAKVLAETKVEAFGIGNNNQYRKTVLPGLEQRLIKLFKADNYNFSEDRFKAAASLAPHMHRKDK